MGAAPPVDGLGLEGHGAQMALLQKRRAQVLKRRLGRCGRARPLICAAISLWSTRLRWQRSRITVLKLQKLQWRREGCREAHRWARAGRACACGSAGCPGTPQSPVQQETSLHFCATLHAHHVTGGHRSGVSFVWRETIAGRALGWQPEVHGLQQSAKAGTARGQMSPLSDALSVCHLSNW